MSKARYKVYLKNVNGVMVHTPKAPILLVIGGIIVFNDFPASDITKPFSFMKDIHLKFKALQ